MMAPAVSTSRKKEKMTIAMGEEQRKAMATLKELSDTVRANAENVGDNFAEEARKIHFGEAEVRGIYGVATIDEANGLAEDGIDFMSLPVCPDDWN